MYRVGSIQLSKQAFVAFVAGTIASIATLLTMRSRVGLYTALFLFAATCYQTYVINCTIVGHCSVLAWFLAVIYIISSVFITLGFKNKY